MPTVSHVQQPEVKTIQVAIKVAILSSTLGLGVGTVSIRLLTRRVQAMGRGC